MPLKRSKRTIGRASTSRYKPFISTYKTRRRRERLSSVTSVLKLILILVIIAIALKLLFWGVSSLIHSKMFDLNGIENFKVTGLNYIKKERILEAFSVDNASIFNVNIKQIRHQIELALPQLQEVSVWREWPNRVMIRVREREPIGIVVLGEGQILGVDKDNVLFRLIDSYMFADKPVITGVALQQYDLGKPMTDPRLVEAVQVLQYIRDYTTYLNDSVDEVNVKDLNKIKVYLNDGSRVILLYLNDEDELDKIKYAEKTFRLYLEGKIQVKEYIDVRFWDPTGKEVVIF